MKHFQKIKWAAVICMILCLIILSGIKEHMQNRDWETMSSEDALADYDYMWHVLENNYPLLNMAERKYHLSTEDLKANYRGQIETLGKNRVDFGDYYEIVQTCIGKFQGLGHLSLYTPYSYQYYLAELQAQKQTGSIDDLTRWRLELLQDPAVKGRYDYLAKKYNAVLQTKTKSGGNSTNLTFRDIDKDIAYVKIRNFMTSSMLADQETLNDWFSKKAGTKYIIIDISGNGGGNDRYWMDLIVAPNIDEQLKYTSCYITSYGEETREQFALNGTGPENLNPHLEDLSKLPQLNKEDLAGIKYYKPRTIFVSPSREEKLCGGQFFLLVNNKVASAAEGFSMFCKATKFATVVGENTGGDGGGGNVFDIKLPKSGLLIRFRAMHSLNPDGSSNVEFGTTPDIGYSRNWTTQERSYLNDCLEYIRSLEN